MHIFIYKKRRHKTQGKYFLLLCIFLLLFDFCLCI